MPLVLACTLAEHCSYGTPHDEMIRDRIVIGFWNVQRSSLKNDASHKVRLKLVYNSLVFLLVLFRERE